MITIGTDCSGIEAPLQALIQLKIPFIQKWSCEIDKYARLSSESNYPKPEVSYTDMLKRDNSKLPHVDLYVCGFPCQAFSNMGNRLGTSDPRAKIIPKMIDTVKHCLPKICILENVRGFLNIENGIPMKQLINEITKLNYNIHYSLYNTKNYGLPQNRERVYFVCIRKDIQKKEYVKPKECAMKPFKSILEDSNINKGLRCHQLCSPYHLHRERTQNWLGYGIVFNLNKQENIQKFKAIDWSKVAFLSTNSAYKLGIQTRHTISELLR